MAAVAVTPISLAPGVLAEAVVDLGAIEHNVRVLRVVVREGLSADLARALHDDARTALASLDKVKPGGHYDAQHFAH